MNNPYSGGWRYGGGTSNDALAGITNQGIDPEFLKKVAAMGLLGEQPKSALDQATQATPLSGLLDAPGSGGWGNDQARDGQGAAQSGGGYSTSPGGNQMKEVSPAGYSMSLIPSAKSVAALMAGGPLAALMASMQVNKMAPVYDLMVPGMNGSYGGIIGDVTYGGNNDNGMNGLGVGLGGYGSQLGSASGLGLDPNSIGAGFGFGGFGGLDGGGFGGYGGDGTGGYGTDR